MNIYLNSTLQVDSLLFDSNLCVYCVKVKSCSLTCKSSGFGTHRNSQPAKWHLIMKSFEMFKYHSDKERELIKAFETRK